MKHLLLGLALLTGAGAGTESTDTYPKNPDIDALNYAFRLTLSDATDAIVGETNDGGLNDIRNRPITAAHVREALEISSSGPVAEGSVGAGRGTSAFGWKGGIGTSSRVLP